MRQVVEHVCPFKASLLVTSSGYAPAVDEVYKEERDTYLLEKFSWQDLEPNKDGERIVAFAKVDETLLKREPMEEDGYLIRHKRQNKVHFVDLSQDA